MAENTSYLKKLKFDPALTKGFVANYLANTRLVLLVLISVITIGIVSYLSLPRRLNPEIKIPIIVVSAVLPGANPQDIEELISDPLESAISGLSDVKNVSSTSRENVSVIQAEFNSGTDPEKARADVQSIIDPIELPEDAQEPQVQKIDFENQPVWSFVLTNKNSDIASLTRLARDLREGLENAPSIGEVAISGFDEQEILVLIEPSKIASYNLNPFALSAQVKTALSSYPSGSIQTDTGTFALSIDPSITTIEDIRELQINVGTTIVPLSSVASITERSKPNQQPSYYIKPNTEYERAIRFDVFKTESADIDKAIVEGEKEIEETLAKYNEQFEVQTITNTGEEVDEQFFDLLRDFLIVSLLVFVSLFIFLGLRQAFVSLFSIPLTFLISFSVMNFTGITINFLSLFSLLLSLGLLVDDTIVVISAMTSYYRSGKFTPFQTGLLVWRDFIIAILTTTITTVWAFLPLLLSTGIIGEFIKSIPIVVSATLLASLFVALFITLPVMIFLLKPSIPNRIMIFLRILLVVILLAIFFSIVPKGPVLFFIVPALIIFLIVTAGVRLALVRNTKTYYLEKRKENRVVKNIPQYLDHGLISFEKIENRYRRVLAKILSSKANMKRAIIMVGIFSIFSYLLLPLGLVKNEFFPKSDSEFIYASLELPAGSNQEMTKKEGLQILKELSTTPDIKYVTADFGKSFSADSGGLTNGESNAVSFAIVLPAKGERKLESPEISQNLRDKYRSYTKGTFTVTEISGGPPAGADVQIKLFGDDLVTLDNYAENVEKYLKDQEGVIDVNKSIKSGTSKITFEPNIQKMAQYGITRDQLGGLLRTFASGLTLDTVSLAGTGIKDQDITLRLSEKAQRVEDIYKISIPTPTGLVQISDLGTLKLEPNPTLITRENGKRTISISATTKQGFSTSDNNKGLEEFANTKLNLPQGYTWATGGVNEENQNSVNSILQAMMLSFLLIIITMVIQFASFRKALIVMLVIPLSISGVFIILALTGTPLSFPALIGVLALFGIVVKNSILVVDKISQNQKAGMSFIDSVIDGSSSRLEAIALTSMTAILGLLPITLSDPLWRGLGGAIISGLIFSGTIMLFFIPVVYYYWFAPKKREATSKRRPKRI